MKNSLIKQSFLYFALGLVFAYFVFIRVIEIGYDAMTYILIIVTIIDFGIGIALIVVGFRRKRKKTCRK
ncbi:hypothetical protein [Listeria seeligeri]|uniref:hypothetical protein n=1 Tax=Listeria seeligeri TaxID=1640 RepID=UPI001887B2C0|nr:hypothetical protein [Listeria seeligeri]MBF2458599.1 hypothetical protein [Listeria seeligeri]MBF2549672.1 hypothetical protein [Listeria seeligeri]